MRTKIRKRIKYSEFSLKNYIKRAKNKEKTCFSLYFGAFKVTMLPLNHSSGINSSGDLTLL